MLSAQRETATEVHGKHFDQLQAVQRFTFQFAELVTDGGLTDAECDESACQLTGESWADH